jgi:hypothetical protein
MPKLWLVFKDEKGEEKRVEVDRTPFIVGRHSGCNLTITDGRLSREHLQIEWQTDKFVASDTGSSNGTTLNEEKLTEPVALKNEDALNLGGGLDIAIVLEGAEPDKPAEPEPPAAPDVDTPSAEMGVPAAASTSAGTVSAPAGASAAIGSASVPSSATSGGIPTAFFFIAPLLGVFVLAAVIGGIILFGGGEKRVASSSGDDYGDTRDDVDSTKNKDDDDISKPIRSATPSSSGTPSNDEPIASSSPGSAGTELPPAGDTNETAKIERNGAAFIRQIAQNDPRAFLTSEQAAKVNTKVKQVGRSSALADNINSARRNANAIKVLAEQKQLKPQFLAVAAITKLGSSRGDVLQAAQSVVEVYERLRIQIGNENFDDALLMVAAYDQGVAGDSMKMRNMLQELADKSREGTRTIRSIWFLEKNGKITAAEYERALNFLAIGTIVQNPKEFGVNAEALRL